MTRLNWRSLNRDIANKTEQELLDLLIQERTGERRASIMQRIHQRYCALRAARERIEILKEAVKP